MTDEEAAAIRERWHWNSSDLLPSASQAKADIRALLDERAALLAVARVVADGEVYEDSIGGMLIVASPDALLAKARALLAGKGEKQP